MNVKRYVDVDMRRALKKVRDELGPEAVILSNRRGKDGIEILASLEYDSSEPNQFQSMRSPVDQATPEPDTVHANPASANSTGNEAINGNPDVPGQAPMANQSQIDAAFETFLSQYQQPAPKNEPSVDVELMDTMRSEIENLRLLLKDQMNYIGDQHRAMKNPAEAAIFKRFKDCGFHEGLSLKLARKTANYGTIEESWQAALRLIIKHLPVTGQDLVSEGGTFAFIGPTGAGKTTTIAKFAIRYALRHGAENLALVSTDQHRIAAYEQLRTLARIIDVPVRLVDEQNDLDSVLRSLRHKRLVLIDMAGFSAGDGFQNNQLKQLRHAKAAISKLLVLPCTSQRSVLSAAIRVGKVYRVDGCVLTKTDEITSLGEVLSLVVEKQLPVTYITNGQSIPDDIELAQAKALIDKTCGKYIEIPAAVQKPANQVTKTATNNARQTINPAQVFAGARI